MSQVGSQDTLRNAKNAQQNIAKQGVPSKEEIQERVEKFDDILEKAKRGSRTTGLNEGLGNSLSNPSGADMFSASPQSSDTDDNTLGVTLNERFKFNMEMIASKVSEMKMRKQGPPIPEHFQNDVKDIASGKKFTREEVDIKVKAFASYAATMQYTAKGADNEEVKVHAYMKIDFAMMAQVKMVKTYQSETALDALVDGMQNLEEDEHPHAKKLRKKQEDFFTNMLEQRPVNMGEDGAPVVVPTDDIPVGLRETLKMRFAMSMEYSSTVRNVVSRLNPGLQDDIRQLAEAGDVAEDSELIEDAEELAEEERVAEEMRAEEAAEEDAALTEEARRRAAQDAVETIIESD